MATAFFAHARSDHSLATQLADFLEFGCNLTCYVKEGLIGEDQDLITKAEDGLCAEVLLLLLTPAACPTRWERHRWEPVLINQPKRSSVELVTVLLQECLFPPLLRRRNFIDATTNWRMAWRLLKRWFWVWERETDMPPTPEFSNDLEALYLGLSDRAGTLQIGGSEALRFAIEAEEEFESVLWVPCKGRTLAQAADELGHQLGFPLHASLKQNCRLIRDFLVTRRCLVVLDAPEAAVARELIAGGRTSTAITTEAVKVIATSETAATARNLSAGRSALQCAGCGHRWIRKSNRRPIVCPRCNSMWWDDPLQPGEVARRFKTKILRKRGF